MIEIIPIKKWQKKKRPSLWREQKLWVHKTRGGKGIIAQITTKK